MVKGKIAYNSRNLAKNMLYYIQCKKRGGQNAENNEFQSTRNRD